MTDTSISVVAGIVVLLFASISVAGHYLREHRRARLLRRLDGSLGYEHRLGD